MSSTDIDALADKIIENSKDIINRIKTVHGIDGAIKAIPEVVTMVEKFADIKAISSEEKRKLAVAIINKLVDIPVIPEAVEGVIIGYGVDMFVMGLNRLFGKDWLEKLS